MAPTFKLVAGAPKADLFVVPVFSGAQLGPGAQLVDDAIGGTLAEFMQETDFDGKRGEVLAVPTGGRLGARAALLLGVGDAETFDAAALRRGGAVLARRAAKVASVATTLLDAVASRRRSRLAAQAFAEGVCLGRYQFLRYKSEAKASQLKRVARRRRGATRRCAPASTAARASRRRSPWARDLDQRTGGGEVAGRRRRARPRWSRARRASR